MEPQPRPEQAPPRALLLLRGAMVFPILLCFGVIGNGLLHGPEFLGRRLFFSLLFYGSYCTLVWWLIKSNPPQMSGVKLAAFAGSVIAGSAIWFSFRIFDSAVNRGLGLLVLLGFVAVVHVGMAASAFTTYNGMAPKGSATRVVAQILVIPGIAGLLTVTMPPSPARSMDVTGERSAAASLRAISSANVQYFKTYQQGYAGTLAQLGPSSNPSSAAASLLDAALSGVDPPTPEPYRGGYRFTYKAPHLIPTGENPNSSFYVVATPIETGGFAKSTFCVDQTQVVGRDASGKAMSATAAGCDFTVFEPY